MRPLRNTGRIMVMSKRWPVPEPGIVGDDDVAGLQRLRRESLQHVPRVTGALPMNTGMPNVPCAIELVSASSTTQVRS